MISDIPFDRVLQLKKILDENEIASFIYGLVDEELYLLYEGLFDEADQAYIKKRGPMYHTFKKDLASLSEMSDSCKVIFFVGYGSYEKRNGFLIFPLLLMELRQRSRRIFILEIILLKFVRNLYRRLLQF